MISISTYVLINSEAKTKKEVQTQIYSFPQKGKNQKQIYSEQ